MKSHYTQKEMKRIITEKAVEIINKNPEALLTNCSFGTGLELVIGLRSYDEMTYWYVGLERNKKDKWHEDGYTLVVIKEHKHEIIERTELMKVWESHTKKGVMYFTSKEPVEKYYARYRNKCYHEKRIEKVLHKESKLCYKLIAKIEHKTGRKLKSQDLIVQKGNRGYVIYYTYRKQPGTLYMNFK